MISNEPKSVNNVIEVEMGECIVLDGESQACLQTDGLGPCVGVAVAIKTVDGKVHRLLGHIVMEEEESFSFEELRECSKKIKTNTKGKINNIEISFTTSQSYRDRSNLTEDEILLLGIIKKEFGFSFRDIRFCYGQQVAILPNGVITNNYEKNESQKHGMI